MGQSIMVWLIGLYVLIVAGLCLAVKHLGVMGLLGLIPIGVSMNDSTVQRAATNS